MVLSFVSVSCRQTRKSEVNLWLISGQIETYKLIKKSSRPKSSLRRCATTNRRDLASIWLARGLDKQVMKQLTGVVKGGHWLWDGEGAGGQQHLCQHGWTDRLQIFHRQLVDVTQPKVWQNLSGRGTLWDRERLRDSIILSFAKHVSHRIYREVENTEKCILYKQQWGKEKLNDLIYIFLKKNWNLLNLTTFSLAYYFRIN